jgi:hypothetical protein
MAQAVVAGLSPWRPGVALGSLHVGFVVDLGLMGQAGISQSSSVFPCQYLSIVALHVHITWGMNNRSVSGRSSNTVSPYRYEEHHK